MEVRIKKKKQKCMGSICGHKVYFRIVLFEDYKSIDIAIILDLWIEIVKKKEKKRHMDVVSQNLVNKGFGSSQEIKIEILSHTYFPRKRN